MRWLAALVVVMASPAFTGSHLPVDPAAQDLVNGAEIYRQHCAACHGADLEGQENWQRRNDDGTYPAPPHDQTGHTWHHDDALLLDYIALGGEGLFAARGIAGPKSGMPPFAEVISHSDIRDVLAYIKSRWPGEYAAGQAARTAAQIRIGE